MHKRLIEVQKTIPDLMTVHSIPFNGEKIAENIKANMDGLNFEECVLRITQFVSFYKKDDFKKKVLESLEISPLSHLFSNNIINEHGQTVFVLPSLDFSNPEANKTSFELHIHHAMLEHERITGSMFLTFALKYIREKFDVKSESLEFLVSDSCIIPDERKSIISKGLYCAFVGEYYEALHILAPQAENLFRYIAKEVGGLTLTLGDNGASEEKSLKSVFDLDELKECYDNDILFMFKGLLNEKAGANIRNEVAHGIMNPYRSFSGECLFFLCVFVKLLAISSLYCGEILCNEKLKSYIRLDEGILLESENED